MSVKQDVERKLLGAWKHRPEGLHGPVINFYFDGTNKVTDGRTVPYEVQVGPRGILIVASDETVIVDEMQDGQMIWRKGTTQFIITRL